MFSLPASTLQIPTPEAMAAANDLPAFQNACILHAAALADTTKDLTPLVDVAMSLVDWCGTTTAANTAAAVSASGSSASI